MTAKAITNPTATGSCLPTSTGFGLSLIHILVEKKVTGANQNQPSRACCRRRYSHSVKTTQRPAGEGVTKAPPVTWRCLQQGPLAQSGPERRCVSAEVVGSNPIWVAQERTGRGSGKGRHEHPRRAADSCSAHAGDKAPRSHRGRPPVLSSTARPMYARTRDGERRRTGRNAHTVHPWDMA